MQPPPAQNRGSQLSCRRITTRTKSPVSHIIVLLPVCLLLLAMTTARAQLDIAVSRPKIEGNKAVVKLVLTNNFTNTVKSVRATVSFSDQQSKVVAQGTRWVVGGLNQTRDLPPGGTNAFYFVINANKPFPTTNLNVNLMFNKGSLKDSKPIAPPDVKIHQ